jgi:hypothetical protein
MESPRPPFISRNRIQNQPVMTENDWVYWDDHGHWVELRYI